MSIHIGAQRNQVAQTVLLPGDPIRAKEIAQAYFGNPILYNQTRNMLGYTGTTIDRKTFSVQGSGMGQPSLSIYVNELFQFYNVETIVRVGTFGSYHEDIPCRSIFLPDKAITDSNMNRNVAEAAPSSDLWHRAKQAAEDLHIPIKTGTLFSTDTFYDSKEYQPGEKKDWEVLAQQGIVGVEMESHALFCLGKKFKKKTLTMLVASDNLVTGEKLSAREREKSFGDMMKIILEII